MWRFCRWAAFTILVLLALANFERLGEFFGQFLAQVAEIPHSDLVEYDNPNFRFAVLGVLVVAAVAIARLLFDYLSKRTENDSSDNSS